MDEGKGIELKSTGGIGSGEMEEDSSEKMIVSVSAGDLVLSESDMEENRGE